MKLINDFFKKSELLRPGFIKSLCDRNSKFKNILQSNISDVPDMFYELYAMSNGTDKNIKQQRYFDFLPGYRLMHVEEVVYAYTEFKELKKYDLIIPFLNDYSCSYYAYAKIKYKEYIVLISDMSIDVIHNSVMDFWKTINAFYDENVYYLDKDGYLSYDYDMEGIIGKKYNNEVGFWQ